MRLRTAENSRAVSMRVPSRSKSTASTGWCWGMMKLGRGLKGEGWDHAGPPAARASAAGLAGMHQVVDADIGGMQAVAVRNGVVHQSGELPQLEPRLAQPPGQLGGPDEAPVVMGAPGQQAQQVFGAENGEQIGPGVAVEGGDRKSVV